MSAAEEVELDLTGTLFVTLVGKWKLVMPCSLGDKPFVVPTTLATGACVGAGAL